MKVVINGCFGRYKLSEAAYKFLRKKRDGYGLAFSRDRANPKLVQCVETLGQEADGDYANLKVVEIPDGVDFEIEGYDGVERIAEKHRIWA
jgi:hypothetical protein